MAGSTTHVPMTVNDLITKLKLLPLDMKIQISNKEGLYYIENLIITEDKCNISLELIPTT